MGQFGVHCIVALILSSIIPFFHPKLNRIAFIYGLFWGCVFPDLDVYSQAAFFFFNPELASKLHRTYLHSMITASFLFLSLTIFHFLFQKKKVNKEDEVFLVESSKNNKNFNLLWFGFGLFLGISCHCLIDIFFWFSFIDIAWPLSFWKFQVINLWKDITVPSLYANLVGILEMLFMAIYFTLLRVSVKKKMQVEPLLVNKKIFNLIKYVEAFHYIYFFILVILYLGLGVFSNLLTNSTVFLLVFVVLLTISNTTFYFFSWSMRQAIVYTQGMLPDNFGIMGIN